MLVAYDISEVPLREGQKYEGQSVESSGVETLGTKSPGAKVPRIKTRLLKKDEMALYLDHLLRLDMKSRELRFDHAMCDGALIIHTQQLAKLGTRVLGAFVDGKLCGAAEISQPYYRRCLKREIARELAFSIESLFAGMGIGSQLMSKSLRLIRPATSVMYCQIYNIGMITLAEKFGADLNLKRDYVECVISFKKESAQKKSKTSNQFGLVSMRDLTVMNPSF